MTVAPAKPPIACDVDAALMAGAYARGLADMLHLLRVPAMLAGKGGRILHANPYVPALMGSALGIEGRRLVFADPSVQRSFAGAFGRFGTSSEDSPTRIILPVAQADDVTLRLHIVPIPRSGDGVQMVHAVILLDDGGLDSADLAFAGMSGAAERPGGQRQGPH